MNGKRDVSVHCGHAVFRFQSLEFKGYRLHAEVWGTHVLAEPGPLPISQYEEEHADLLWPGFDGPVSEARALAMLHMESVFIRDAVLKNYEEFPEYEVNPEHGSVDYEGRWIVGPRHRVGRDLIQIELRELYKGNPPHVVKLWNEHAVPPPVGDAASPSTPNVATRSKRVVFAVLSLAEALSALGSSHAADLSKLTAFVPWGRDELAYSGWWKPSQIAPITRHIPSPLSREEFLKRCQRLHRVTVEAWNQAHLRRLATSVGMPPATTGDWRSLKMLDFVVKACAVAVDAGLFLPGSASAMQSRLTDAPDPMPIKAAFVLNDLRQLESHISDASSDAKLAASLEYLGIEPQAVTDYGNALDKMYEAVALAYETATTTIRRAIQA